MLILFFTQERMMAMERQLKKHEVHQLKIVIRKRWPVNRKTQAVNITKGNVPLL
jgi:hypothetical protein